MQFHCKLPLQTLTASGARTPKNETEPVTERNELSGNSSVGRTSPLVSIEGEREARASKWNIIKDIAFYSLTISAAISVTGLVPSFDGMPPVQKTFGLDQEEADLDKQKFGFDKYKRALDEWDT